MSIYMYFNEEKKKKKKHYSHFHRQILSTVQGHIQNDEEYF